MARILVCDDERSMRELLEILLTKAGHAVVVEDHAAGACQRVSAEEFDLVITDLKLGRRSGLEVLERTKQTFPTTEVIVITAYNTMEDEIRATQQLGAFYFLPKPFKVDAIDFLVRKALEKRAIVRENVEFRRKLGERQRYPNLRGRSESIRALLALVEKIAPTRSTVLVSGESGVGKELVARAIHEKGPRADRPFVAVNCGAIPEGLIESELFGHEKGAFTGAVAAKEGLFATASGGTLFLDEVGELPQSVQVKLLRALQERTIRAVGGVKDFEVDTRIIAATNRDLAAEVRSGRFREDLYYRLNVIGLKVPPLRERREDLLPLADHFLEAFSREQGLSPRRLSKEAQALLLDYDYPGNVRELENIVERAVTLADGEVIDPGVLPAQVRAAGGVGDAARAPSLAPVPAQGELPSGFDLQLHLDEYERRILARALAQAKGVKKEAARILGLSFRSLRYRLEKLKMEPPGGDE